MAQRLDDKVAIVTGGAQGIGAACVRRFSEEGVRVVIGDIDQERGQALADELEQTAFERLDVTDELSFTAAIESTVKRWGRLDILVNNAAVALPSVPVQETSSEEFDRFINVNLRGAYHGMKLAYSQLCATRGCVLNISSMAGITGHQDHAIYAATKGAINTLTKSTAVDWGSDGVRVNALCPVSAWTDTLRAWCDEQPDASQTLEYLQRVNSLGYCPEPHEIASVAAFLCSDDARFVTGCVMPVSGGSECGYRV